MDALRLVWNIVQPSKQRYQQSDGRTQILPELKSAMPERKIAIKSADTQI
jgi:hypothetical protein